MFYIDRRSHGTNVRRHIGKTKQTQVTQDRNDWGKTLYIPVNYFNLVLAYVFVIQMKTKLAEVEARGEKATREHVQGHLNKIKAITTGNGDK